MPWADILKAFRSPKPVSKQRKSFDLASDYIGLKEIKGSEHNETVVNFFKEVGHSWVKDDETAWCAAFAGAILERAGLPSTRKLNARSYLEWGEEVAFDDLETGDIVVFWRKGKNSAYGHVAFFVGLDPQGDLRVLGGNQSNEVNIATYKKERFLQGRRMKG